MADGKSLEFVWNGTQLGVRQEGMTSYQYVELKGATGAKGNTGDKGATGSSPNISIGSVQTTDELLASASVTGTNPNYLLNLSIPRGVSGSNGKSLEFQWSGTQLRLRQEGGTWGSYVDLRGEQGVQGIKGDNGDTVINQRTGSTLKIWTGTQEQYDAIAVKDSETAYLVY